MANPSDEAAIRLDGVSKSYDDEASYAVREVHLTVAFGEFLALVGTSGCGKTTTLKMINRLIEPTRGAVYVHGKNVLEGDPVRLRRSMGYVFQGIGLFPHLTVAENVATVPSLLGWPGDQTERRVEELLGLVNLPPEEFRHRFPRLLSGGQKQRVGLARALAARPGIMLMDEPFGALDPLTRDNLREEYRRIHEELELTTVMVTHDLTEALLLADRIAVMDAGRIQWTGIPAAMIAETEHEFVRRMTEMPKRHIKRLDQLADEAP